MLNFMLPGMYEHSDLNFQLLYLLKTAPELFYNDINISACYGNFQFCIWDGGRIFQNYYHTNAEEIEKLVQKYNDFGVPVRQIFTNCELKPEHYYDRFCNRCLELTENGFNEIVVNDPGLENYIREKYPDFIFISSTTKCITNTSDLITELKKDYKYVCLDYNLNHNFKFLESLPQELKDKCEFLVNAICPSGCVNRKNHYRLNSLYHLSYCKSYRVPTCPIKGNTLAKSTFDYPNHISIDEILNTYSKMNFSHFKLEGRTLSKIEVVGNYAHYLVKPENYLYFYSQMLY